MCYIKKKESRKEKLVHKRGDLKETMREEIS